MKVQNKETDKVVAPHYKQHSTRPGRRLPLERRLRAHRWLAQFGFWFFFALLRVMVMREEEKLRYKRNPTTTGIDGEGDDPTARHYMCTKINTLVPYHEGYHM